MIEALGPEDLVTGGRRAGIRPDGAGVGEEGPVVAEFDEYTGTGQLTQSGSGRPSTLPNYSAALPFGLSAERA